MTEKKADTLQATMDACDAKLCEMNWKLYKSGKWSLETYEEVRDRLRRSRIDVRREMGMPPKGGGR